MNKRIEDIDITQESVDDFFRLPEMKRIIKNFKHMLHGYKPIKRIRKRQIARAKHMMAWHDHTSYEYSQWWHKTARKPKRWK
ncbi:hypothetical protein [Limosilactobacillus reuteri]|uniref:Uncharacterized protein n=1 Tax=Limosilactobacillus reuteri TaxID=1598 RepID=A0A256SR91_LIMRT|nr:hypothetical protein [Limosilactobacillus reuteri]OYS69206.1 hypothetical protein CBF96_05140 [Limosilactobacillus reuteri]